MKEKIVLGLSGGVDSAVSAALLRRDYDVICLWLDVGAGGAGREDAAAVARRLDLPFETMDIRGELERHVKAPFTRDYLEGRTPLPCALCNVSVKFPALLRAADRLGAPLVATGHYARTAAGEGGRPLLLKGRPENDQSYMLARLTKPILARARFPLGAFSKKEVRALAKALDLPVFSKPDSMEICFIPEGDYAAWLESRGAVPPPGDFVDEGGRLLGRHRGIHHYTLGQRRGLGIAAGRRIYVSKLDPAANTVTLSEGETLLEQEALCRLPNWIAVDGLSGPLPVTVRLRHTRREQEATLSPRGDLVHIALSAPARAPTPGQLAVFYRGETVVGSGWLV